MSKVHLGGDLSLKAVILIRERMAACLLKSQIQMLGNLHEIVAFHNPGKALQYLEGSSAERVFLDVDENPLQSFAEGLVCG
jgi:hypothetical protein